MGDGGGGRGVGKGGREEGGWREVVLNHKEAKAEK